MFRKPESRSRYAVFTIAKNEPLHIMMWLKHYAREFPLEDNNGGNDTIPDVFAGVNLVQCRCEKYFDHHCIVNIVEAMLATLLRYVVFSESDEFIYVDGGVCNYLNMQSDPHIRVRAYELFHLPDDEYPIDWDRELVGQRQMLFRHVHYDKPLENAQPVKFSFGFHRAKDAKAANPNDLRYGLIETRHDRLIMLHMQKIDYDYFIEKGEWKAKQNLHSDVTELGFGGHHRLFGDRLAESYWKPTLELLEKFHKIGGGVVCVALLLFIKREGILVCVKILSSTWLR